MHGQRHLMIIDDSRVSRMMMTTLIKTTHPEITIHEASNGQEAIDVSLDKSIDYFSVDYNMPGINGLETIEKLKQSFPEAVYALLSANTQDAIVSRAKESHINCFKKPINEELISSLMEHFING